ncbi:zinc finger and BTB domain-containing protein 17-like [Anopheles cruzii]|uniref:zinc finger and BTB domain-containing protein 17-like n=1 Tax=Anopheles cruzii TaxID=68878 RepID=UPI0022EC79BE|nr:zinc finger and BTB domain-containing protein 17-like [Anopheles cruzii]
MDPFDICRVCMEEVDNFWPLFDHCELLPSGMQPATLISKVSGVSVQKDEGLPEMACNSCLAAMVNAYVIRQKCIASDRKLRKILFYRPVLKPPPVEAKELFVAVPVPDTDTLIEHHELHSDANKELVEKQALLAKAGSIIEENVPSLPDENEADAGELDVITVKKEVLNDFSIEDVQYTEEYLVEEHHEHNEVEDHEAASYDEPERLGFDDTIQMEVEIVETENAKQRHICDVCGKEFSTKGNLKSHMVLHTNERPFACEQCGMNFAKKSNYNVYKTRQRRCYVNQDIKKP